MTNTNEKVMQNLITHYTDSVLLPVNSLVPKTDVGTAVKLTYGETYDAYGLTLDSLKYYFFLTVLTKLLKSGGLDVSSSVIVGDVASIRNKNASEEAVQKKTEDNVRLLSKIKATYILPLDFDRMSITFKTNEFKKTLGLVQNIYDQNSEMKRLATTTIMQNKLKQENEAGFLYALEEVALIVDCDVKVGVKREISYDKMVNIVKDQLNKRPLQGVYLKPTYPLGVQFDYFLQHPEIEEYGLTPYKAGSNKMQDKRIIIGVTSIKQVNKLIADSFCSSDVSLPNAVRELYLTGLLAKAVYTKDITILANDEVFELPAKDVVIGIVRDFIYKPLGLE